VGPRSTSLLAAVVVAVAVAGLLLSREGAGASQSPHPRQFRGDRIGSYWLEQAAPGAISEVPDPTGGPGTAFRFTVGNGDETGPGMPNPRAELLSPDDIRGGEEFWWSGRIYLPVDFPARVPAWLNLMQGPFGKPWRGSPAWSIKVSGRWIEWQRNQTYDWDVPWQIPLVRGRWIHVLGHTRFGRHGFVEMWIDGRPVTFFRHSSWNPNRHPPTRRLRMMTRDSSNDAAPNSMYLQSYRKRGMFPSLTIYQGPLRIASSRTAVGG
jgi:hypothetical protein